MRILYVPFFTNKRVESCSTFLYSKMFFVELVKRNKDIFLYFPIPKDSYPNKEVEHKRIFQIPISIKPKQRDELRRNDVVLEEMFDEIYGKYFFDVVISDKPVITGYFCNAVKSYIRTGSGKFVVVNNIQFVIDDTNQNTCLELSFVAQNSLSLAFSDINFMTLNKDIDRLLYQAERFLSPSMINKIKNNSIVNYGSFNPAQLNKYISKLKYKVFTVSWGYGLTIGYKILDVMEKVDKLFCSGRNVEFMVTSSGLITGMTSGNWIKKYKYFKIEEECDQKRYWEITAKCHCFIYIPDLSEMSMSVIEQQYLGVVGIFLDKDYLEGWLYPDYPFKAKSIDEVAYYLRYIYENYNSKEVQDVILKTKKWIEKYNFNKVIKTYYNKIKEKYDAINNDGSDYGIERMLKDILTENDKQFDYLEFKEIVKKRSRNKIDIEKNIGRYGCSKARFRRALLRIGYEDLCDLETPVFRRTN